MYEFWFWESVREVRIYTRAMDWKGIASGRSKVLVYSTIQSHQHFIGAKEKHYSIAIWTPVYISENLCVRVLVLGVCERGENLYQGN